jgi:hypothetical protein
MVVPLFISLKLNLCARLATPRVISPIGLIFNNNCFAKHWQGDHEALQ